MKFALFGGVYNNYLALEAAVHDARMRGVDGLYCLGDIGAFGPHPNRGIELLREERVQCIQGNYDHSIGNSLNDCQCGYTDPRDNHFAQVSYDYTFESTSRDNRAWLKGLPRENRLSADGVEFLLCHGSPRKTNEFIWESTSSTHFLRKLADDHDADVVLGTHTGIHWSRDLGAAKTWINVGVLGRPENDGQTHVWYTIVRTGQDARDRRGSRVEGRGSSNQDIRGSKRDQVDVEFIPLEYDHVRLAREMRLENLPEEFVETILSGWWTTCLEVLPGKERRRGKF